MKVNARGLLGMPCFVICSQLVDFRLYTSHVDCSNIAQLNVASLGGPWCSVCMSCWVRAVYCWCVFSVLHNLRGNMWLRNSEHEWQVEGTWIMKVGKRMERACILFPKILAPATYRTLGPTVGKSHTLCFPIHTLLETLLPLSFSPSMGSPTHSGWCSGVGGGHTAYARGRENWNSSSVTHWLDDPGQVFNPTVLQFPPL